MTIYIWRVLHAKVTDSSTCQLGGDLSGQYKAELNTELYDTELTLTPMMTSAQVVESLEYLGLRYIHAETHPCNLYSNHFIYTLYSFGNYLQVKHFFTCDADEGQNKKSFPLCFQHSF